MKLRVKKVFNNNILLAEDENLLEVILMGRGIGYAMKPGDPADESKIDKVFKITAHQQQEDFVKLMKEIPINHLELTKKIVEMAQKELNVQFDDVIYIGLTDHIHFVIKRAKQNEQLKNALLWEIKKFYPREFAASMKALELIEYSEGLQLTEDEASFIAMHFVNGSKAAKRSVKQ